MNRILDELKAANAELMWQCDSCFGDLQVLQSDRYRYLQVDGHVQSVMDLRERHRACLPHAQWLNVALLSRPNTVLMAGLGGGDLIRQFRGAGLASHFSCCELCPDILHAYHEYFVPESGELGLEILQEDINDFIPQCQRQFDLIVLDVFSGSDQPDCLGEEAFFQNCFECLDERGVLALNVSINEPSSLLQLALILRRVFSKKLLMMPVEGCDNVVMLAFKGKPLAGSNDEFLLAIETLNKTLPSAIPVQIERLVNSNVCDEFGELELWRLP
ncbi:spermidine synthase [Pseudoteredinibacter isoporae]|uniref:spermidine synthase n=1 Tax=Pseudoteredinibacter isoporae TaxID=570281 RepID=UPI003102DF8B